MIAVLAFLLHMSMHIIGWLLGLARAAFKEGAESGAAYWGAPEPPKDMRAIYYKGCWIAENKSAEN